MVKASVKILLMLVVGLATLYFFGPSVSYDAVDNEAMTLDIPLTNIQQYVDNKESKIEHIKADNQSQFVWVDSLSKTPFSVVYLHGYSASHGECQPILNNFAKTFGCNTYLPRLYLHGLSDIDAFAELDPKKWVESAKEAIAIAKIIGEKVIIISTSTGCTLSAYLDDEDVVAHIMTSPNFDLHDPNSQLLVKPWGKQIFRKMMGGDYREWEGNDDIHKYWTTKNRIEGPIAVRELVNQTMTPDVIKQFSDPVFVGYYYKDEENFDDIISIDAIHNFEKQISTPKDKQVFKPFANGKGHVISSEYMNPNWKDVQDAIFEFAVQVVGMKYVQNEDSAING